MHQNTWNDNGVEVCPQRKITVLLPKMRECEREGVGAE